MVTPITPVASDLVAFLNGIGKLEIPELQRPYAWSKDEAGELIDDLLVIIAQLEENDKERDDEVVQAVPGHFFGTFVLLQGQKPRLQIIDGQQRLTTSTLLLALLRQSMIELKESAQRLGQPQALINAIDGDIQAIHTQLWVQEGFDDNGLPKQLPRLLVSHEISATYVAYLRGTNPNIPTENSLAAQKIRDVAQEFIHKLIKHPDAYKGETLDKYRHLTRVRRAVENGLIVVSLTTSSAGAGYGLFESLNAKGKKLNVLDLIKVWMLSELSATDDVELTQKAVLDLRSIAGDDVDLDFFSCYFRAAALVNSRKYAASPKGFSIEVRRRVFKDPKVGAPEGVDLPVRIGDELEKMTRWKPLYVAYASSDPLLPSSVVGLSSLERDWTNRRLNHLVKVLKHKGIVMPLLVVATDYLANDGQRLMLLIDRVEKFFFRYFTICEGPLPKLEEAYYKMMEILQATGTITPQKIEELLGGLISSKADTPTFDASIRVKLRYEPSKSSLIRYFLHTLYADSLNQKLHDNLALWSVEHIVPQNPSGDDAGLDPKWLHSLGNLCLLDPPMNGSLSNRSFKDKKKEVAKREALPLGHSDHHTIGVQDTFQIFHLPQDDWMVSDIQNRENQLVKHALKVYHFNP